MKKMTPQFLTKVAIAIDRPLFSNYNFPVGVEIQEDQLIHATIDYGMITRKLTLVNAALYCLVAITEMEKFELFILMKVYNQIQ